MSARDRSIVALREAKAALVEEFGEREWFRGAGIAPGPTGLRLRLNVDSEYLSPGEKLPETFRGHPVEVVEIGKYGLR